MVMKMVWGIYDINNHHKGENRDMGGRRRGLNRRVKTASGSGVAGALGLANAKSGVE